MADLATTLRNQHTLEGNEIEALLAAVAASGGSGGTAQTVVSGETVTLLPSDRVVRFDTSGGTTATANMVAGTSPGQRVLFFWFDWVPATPTAPTINAPAGQNIAPATGLLATHGSAGLVTTTTMPTPGATFALTWDGTEWAPG